MTVGGIVGAIAAALPVHLRAAQETLPLDENSALAAAHGTRYPILQGPMTRVSDVAPFCDAVGAAGALPFLALALMRGPQVEALLQATADRMAGRPWGVGILGFVPPELRQEQLAVVRAFRPPFAIIAGGRPDQARQLEQEGIVTYLHVPSPNLLDLFLTSGARRFIFEGRECGGHVGPRSSFVLWESMIERLTARIDSLDVNGGDCHVVFAGGIHDARSAAMVAAMAGTLAQRGVKIGVLMGTAYLFTEEAVASGAIVEGFQREALSCNHTVLLETGPGHAIRCADTPFRLAFELRKRDLIQASRPAEELRQALEDLNLGRLRIASKGVNRPPRYGKQPEAPRYVQVAPDQQRAQGMYMLGQVAVLRDRLTTVADLHREVAAGGTAFLRDLAVDDMPEAPPRPSDVAIIGISTILPKAPTLQRYWHNIINKVNAIQEVPEERWRAADYFDPDRTKKDRVYSKWGGFLEPILFDPTAYGIPPSAISSIEPAQLLTLEATRAALADAGYAERPFDREHTSVILGAGGGVGELGQLYGFRSLLPTFFGEQAGDVVQQLGDTLPEWTEDSFAGILSNVAAGRVANRFNFGGANFTVDAACATSLAAVYLGVRELEAGTSNVVVAGGVDTAQSAFAYLCFSRTQALSPRGQCSAFDESADGIVISEGLAMLVLKRLEDAERDGDRIYAVIKGAGASSDGRDKGLTAPRPEGQIRALERAYAKAGVSPATVSLIEAHGTGTVAGDRAEVMALTKFFSRAHAERQSCAIGSAKSMIGHTKKTAGAAAMAKVALALRHRVLPPTIGVERPNKRADFARTPFYVNSEARPWIARPDGTPRRAGVSAFGFGGTNFHVVMEEYRGAFRPTDDALERDWPSELFIWTAGDRAGLVSALAPVDRALSQPSPPRLADLAATTCAVARKCAHAGVRLAIVAQSDDDLRTKLAAARAGLDDPKCSEMADPTGVFFSERPLARQGRIAFLYPGQGSQYPDMGRDLALHFPEARLSFEQTDAVLAGDFARPLSGWIFPPPSFSDADVAASRQALTDTRISQPALGTTAVAVHRVLQALGITPDMAAGHSYGELVALWAAGVMSDDALPRLSEARGRFMQESSAGEPGTMAAVEVDVATVAAALDGLDSVVCANVNAPDQTVISGSRSGVEQAVAAFAAKGVRARQLPVACAFHSPLVAPARARFAEVMVATALRPPAFPVYSNTTGEAHSSDPIEVGELFADHLVRPVEFVREIESMYRDGARIFIEVGPKGVLTGLVCRILAGRSHVAIATDAEGRSGLQQLLLALARLTAEGVDVHTDRLFAGRWTQELRLEDPGTAIPTTAPAAWLVSAAHALPLRDAGKPVQRRRLSIRIPEVAGGLIDTDIPAPKPAGREQAPSGVDASIPMSQPMPVSNGHLLPRSNGHVVVPSAGAAAMPSASAQPLLARADVAEMVGRFQHVMGRYLDTQQSVMLSYLGGPVAPAEAVPAPPAEATLSPPELVTPPFFTAEVASAPPAAKPAPAAPTLTCESITALFLAIVSDRTGYPLEMLGLDLDVEADLGIDSIKWVEILSTFQEQQGDSAGRIESAMETLTTTKTLRGIVERVTALGGSNGVESPVSLPGVRRSTLA